MGKGIHRHYLSMIAAVLFATLLVGSLVLVLTHARQTSTGGGGSGVPTPTMLPTSVYGPGWQVVATFRGTGSETIKGQHIVVHHALGVQFTCVGSGKTSIMLNGPTGKGFRSLCHVETRGHFSYKLLAGAPYTIAYIDIGVNKASVWELQLATCVDASLCDPHQGPTPTPAATSIPTPTPTEIPSPTPTPRP